MQSTGVPGNELQCAKPPRPEKFSFRAVLVKTASKTVTEKEREGECVCVCLCVRVHVGGV